MRKNVLAFLLLPLGALAYACSGDDDGGGGGGGVDAGSDTSITPKDSGGDSPFNFPDGSTDGGKAAHECLVDRPVRIDRLASAAQQHRVARAQAERRRVRGDAGPRLVDHQHRAERRAHPLDCQPARARPALHHLADGVGLGRDLADGGQ